MIDFIQDALTGIGSIFYFACGIHVHILASTKT